MIGQLKIHVTDHPFFYTGAELRPHFLLEKFQIKGSGLLVAVGGADVQTEKMVDQEDRLAGDFIAARSMVHVLGEFFWAGQTYFPGVVFFQRLIVACARDTLGQILAARSGTSSAEQVIRDGDDLYVVASDSKAKTKDLSRRKLSVSIATVSGTSALIHFAINIDSSGSPVAAAGLQDLGISAAEFISDFISRVDREWQGVEWACTKVRPVF